jgi:modulator of FtsH protease
MGRSYDPGAWQPFFETVVAAAAALLGLLFVAASVRISVVADSPRHRARAREALGQLLVLVVLGVVVLVPGQKREALGAELLAYGVVVAGITIRLQTNTLRRVQPELRRRWILRDMTYNVGVASILIAGLGLVVESLGGLYWLVITTIVFFVWASLQAWYLLIEPP